MTPLTHDPYTNAVLATGMQRGARICEAEHDEMLGDALVEGSLWTLAVVLVLAVGAAWLGRTR